MKQSEQEMADWLAHPMEFGEPPEHVEEIHCEKTYWPLFDKKIDLSFHRYRMKDGFSSIGMTGPITWSFLGDDLSGFTMEELKRLYAAGISHLPRSTYPTIRKPEMIKNGKRLKKSSKRVSQALSVSSTT